MTPIFAGERLGNHGFLGLELQEAVAGHDRLEKAVVDGPIQDIQVVAGDPDMVDQTFVARLEQPLQGAPLRRDPAIGIEVLDEVALVELDFVPPELLQADLDIPSHLVGALLQGLRGQDRPLSRFP